jgi:hypothetical protein
MPSKSVVLCPCLRNRSTHQPCTNITSRSLHTLQHATHHARRLQLEARGLPRPLPATSPDASAAAGAAADSSLCAAGALLHRIGGITLAFTSLDGQSAAVEQRSVQEVEAGPG